MQKLRLSVISMQLLLLCVPLAGGADQKTVTITVAPPAGQSFDASVKAALCKQVQKLLQPTLSGLSISETPVCSESSSGAFVVSQKVNYTPPAVTTLTNSTSGSTLRATGVRSDGTNWVPGTVNSNQSVSANLRTGSQIRVTGTYDTGGRFSRQVTRDLGTYTIPDTSSTLTCYGAMDGMYCLWTTDNLVFTFRNSMNTSDCEMQIRNATYISGAAWSSGNLSRNQVLRASLKPSTTFTIMTVANFGGRFPNPKYFNFTVPATSRTYSCTGSCGGSPSCN